MALGRNHVLVIVAVAGIMALALAVAGLFSGKQGAGYVRINVSEESAVWLEFDGAALRAAASAEGLKTAEPVPLRALNFQNVAVRRIHAADSRRPASRRHQRRQGELHAGDEQRLGPTGNLPDGRAEGRLAMRRRRLVEDRRPRGLGAGHPVAQPGEACAGRHGRALAWKTGNRGPARGRRPSDERRAQGWKARAGAGERDRRRRQRGGRAKRPADRFRLQLTRPLLLRRSGERRVHSRRDARRRPVRVRRERPGEGRHAVAGR